MDLLNLLKWRYATKKYSSKKVSDDTLQNIIEAINLSASSAGMQPYRLIVIENLEIRKQIGAGSFNSQIVEASHLLVFAAFTGITKQDIEKYIERVATERNTTTESLSAFKNSLEGFLLSRTDEQNHLWAARQAYIALGTGLIAAASLQVDATPMEGFNSENVDKVLGLTEKGLKSVVIMAVGYRDEQDTYASLQKVRLATEDFASIIH